MIAHKLIDALIGSKKYDFIPVPGLSREMFSQCVARLRRAECFDFGSLVLEKSDEQSGEWFIPKLTSDEIEFWRLGLVPLPAPVVWLEFELGGTRSGYLVRADGSRWIAERLDLAQRTVVYDGVELICNQVDELIGYQIGHEKSALKIRLAGPPETIEFLERSKHPQVSAEMHAYNFQLVLYLVLMINSRTTERRRVAASQTLNASRARRGRAQIADHTVVTICPQRFVADAAAEGVRTHRPPRLHWRRSHLRHYDHQVPSAKFVEEAEHDGRRGWWLTVIPRFLVGRADLGEVSHEYRVIPPKKEAA